MNNHPYKEQGGRAHIPMHLNGHIPSQPTPRDTTTRPWPRHQRRLRGGSLQARTNSTASWPSVAFLTTWKDKDHQARPRGWAILENGLTASHYTLSTTGGQGSLSTTLWPVA